MWWTYTHTHFFRISRPSFGHFCFHSFIDERYFGYSWIWLERGKVYNLLPWYFGLWIWFHDNLLKRHSLTKRRQFRVFSWKTTCGNFEFLLNSFRYMYIGVLFRNYLLSVFRTELLLEKVESNHFKICLRTAICPSPGQFMSSWEKYSRKFQIIEKFGKYRIIERFRKFRFIEKFRKF